MNRIFVFLLLCLFFTLQNDAFAQKRPSVRKILNHDHFDGMFDPGNPQSDFLKTQFWLGYKMGAGLTKANNSQSYSAFDMIGAETENVEKNYTNFKDVSGHAGLEITIYHKGFYISFQPEFRRNTFSFTNSFEWTSGQDANRNILQDFEQQQRLDYVNFPLIVKYDLINKKIKPFVQGGLYYGTLVGASREITRNTTDNASGAQGSALEDKFSLNNKDAFINSNIGYIAGLGLNADVLKARLVLDIQYRSSFNNITNVKTRFDDDRLTNFGDVLDDVKLTNLSVNLGILFPLKYVGSGDYVNKPKK